MLNYGKRIYNEKKSIDYTLQSDYYLPDLTPDYEYRPIGLWGQLHVRYLKQNHKVLFQTADKVHS